MKTNNFFKMAVATVIFCGSIYGSRSLAQATGIAGANANIIVPISIAKNVDMNFGNAAVASGVGGSIVLAPAGTRTTTGSGVTFPAVSGTVAAASFTVSGAPGYTYAITLPVSAVINGPGSASMAVSGFTSNPNSTGSIATGGTQSLSVGATLTVAPAQMPGLYTNAVAVPVTVNYN